MQALNNLAIEYATFEQASANLEVEISEGDLLFADVRTAVEEFTDAQQHQERMQGELKNFQVCPFRSVVTNAEFTEANRQKDRIRESSGSMPTSVKGA